MEPIQASMSQAILILLGVVNSQGQGLMMYLLDEEKFTQKELHINHGCI